MSDIGTPPNETGKDESSSVRVETKVEVDTLIQAGGNKPDESLTGLIIGYKGDVLDRSFINLLRRSLIRLRPSEEALTYLTELCEYSRLSERHGGKPKPLGSLPYFKFFSNRLSLKNIETKHSYFEQANNKAALINTFDDSDSSNAYNSSGLSVLDKQYMNVLSSVLSGVFPTESYLDIQQDIRAIADEIILRIENINYIYTSAIRPAISKTVLLKNMVSKIGRQDLREEANCHLNTINQLAEHLNNNWSTTVALDVLSDEAQAIIGVMIEIEIHRIYIEKLLLSAKIQKQETILLVLIYVIVVIILFVILPIVLIYNGQIRPLPMNELETHKLAFVGIPWPVIVWSLIGSFASMIHRFNSRPIDEFQDNFKWMLTRHIQGVVLSSAFYLVLTSGLFLLTGIDVTQSNESIRKEIVLVLSFLIGFSDRFVDSVFDTLINKYSMSPSTTDERQLSDRDKS